MNNKNNVMKAYSRISGDLDCGTLCAILIQRRSTVGPKIFLSGQNPGNSGNKRKCCKKGFSGLLKQNLMFVFKIWHCGSRITI